jgi:3'(2'), 5'-bisphosphate nucleotidase
MSDARLVDQVAAIAAAAGDLILEVYDREYEIIEKADGSPVTTADHRAHDLIAERLHALTPDIPVLSEESRDVSDEDRLGWPHLWVVDPLDGTKEFIKRNGEFTVNIGLIDNGQPVLGVVYTPVRCTTYFAALGEGAWRTVDTQVPQRISVRPYAGGAARMVASRSHSGPPVQAFLQALEAASGAEVETISLGSALKVCLVAEGSADVYPRLGPTSEWDTCASHCVLNEAGGIILDCSGNELTYNKPDILNPWFLAVGDAGFDWVSLCSKVSS